MTDRPRPRGPYEGSPMEDGKEYPRLESCPDCKGRGWFFINPFATGGSNGAGGTGNMTPCQTCQWAYDFYQEHGKLPDEIIEEIRAQKKS